MELRHLHYFVVLARYLHFTRAAEELLIAQPALSQQIQALERELGVRLFERTSRHIRLTPAGQGLLVHAERVLADVDTLVLEMKSYAGLKRGSLRIGLILSLGVSRLPRLLARFHAHYQGIELLLHEDVTESLIEQVEERKLDLAWMHSISTIFPHNVLPKHIKAQRVTSEPLFLAAEPHHHLIGQKNIGWDALQAEDFIVFKWGTGLRQVVLHVGQTAGFRPHIVFESGDISAISSLVSEGVGISVFPQSAIDAAGKKIVPLDLSPALPQRTVQLIWYGRKPLDPTIQAFLDFVQGDLRTHAW